jgi:putative transposase
MWFDVTRRRFSIEQIVAALRQAEAGTPEAELIRRLGISPMTFSRWRRLYGAMRRVPYRPSGRPRQGLARRPTGIR